MIRAGKKVVLLAALSLLGMTTMATSPAEAAAKKCTLSITGPDTDGPDRAYRVEVTCSHWLPYARWDLFGDDGDQGAQYLFSGYQPVLLADQGALDEDFGQPDEYFADVVYQSSTGAYWTVRTNTVYHNVY